MATVVTKQCKMCGLLKGGKAFGNDISRPDGKYPYCRACRKKYVPYVPGSEQRTCAWCDEPYMASGKAILYCSKQCANKASNIGKKYNLTGAEWRALIAATGGYCPICQRKVKKWAVDHNHETLEIHGVLCIVCNRWVLGALPREVGVGARIDEFLSNPPARQILGERRTARQWVTDKRSKPWWG